MRKLYFVQWGTQNGGRSSTTRTGDLFDISNKWKKLVISLETSEKSELAFNNVIEMRWLVRAEIQSAN